MVELKHSKYSAITKRKLISLITLLTLIMPVAFTQSKSYDTLQVRVTGKNLQSGFYFALRDTGNSDGFKVYNSNEYYFLSSSPVVTLVDFDTIYKDFMPNLDNHVLIFRFNEAGTKNWFEFTERYQNQQTGLVIDNKLVYVATNASPIESGVSWLAGGIPKNRLTSLKKYLKSN